MRVPSGNVTILLVGPMEGGASHRAAAPALPGRSCGALVEQLCASPQHRQAGKSVVQAPTDAWVCNLMHTVWWRCSVAAVLIDCKSAKRCTHCWAADVEVAAASLPNSNKGVHMLIICDDAHFFPPNSHI